MIKGERLDRILEILKHKKYCTVDELVSKLRYSPATIRRDLTLLEKQNLVKKSYGGVSYKDEKPMVVREHDHVSGKMKVCMAAGELIKEGDVVFVDATTTTYYLAEILVKRKVAFVVTTNLKLAIYLCELGVPCFVAAGKLQDSAMVGGPLAASSLEAWRFDIAFFGVGAVSDSGELSVADFHCEPMRVVMGNSGQSVCLYDKSKCKVSSKVYFKKLDMFDCVISDGEFPQSFERDFPKTKFIVAE